MLHRIKHHRKGDTSPARAHSEVRDSPVPAIHVRDASDAATAVPAPAPPAADPPVPEHPSLSREPSAERQLSVQTNLSPGLVPTPEFYATRPRSSTNLSQYSTVGNVSRVSDDLFDAQRLGHGSLTLDHLDRHALGAKTPVAHAPEIMLPVQSHSDDELTPHAPTGAQSFTEEGRGEHHMEHRHTIGAVDAAHFPDGMHLHAAPERRHRGSLSFRRRKGSRPPSEYAGGTPLAPVISSEAEEAEPAVAAAGGATPSRKTSITRGSGSTRSTPHAPTHATPHSTPHGTAAAGPLPTSTSQRSTDDPNDFSAEFAEKMQPPVSYVVSTGKRNTEFHALFKNVSPDDLLVQDYGCALQRDILLQGRMYISEHHLCFSANIFGWVTALALPFAEIVSIEKKMTAYVIPNAIQVTTLHARHVFASFLARDATYDLVSSIWRAAHPVVPPAAALPDMSATDSESDTTDSDAGNARIRSRRRRLKASLKRRHERLNATLYGLPAPADGPAAAATVDAKPTPGFHRVTTDTCPVLKDLKEVCLDAVFPTSLPKLHELLFHDEDFILGFFREQRLFDISLAPWDGVRRQGSYIKPLNGSIGPRQTKCIMDDEEVAVDTDAFVTVVTTTRTPDVPSGASFAVKTRTSLTWARRNHCRVVVKTGVEWSKSSFLRSVIEKSCVDGQKQYHTDLERALNAHIDAHRDQFIEEPPADAHEEEEHLEPHPKEAASPTAPLSEDSIGTYPLMDVVKTLGSVFAPIWSLITGLSFTNLALVIILTILVLSNTYTLLRTPSRATPPRLHYDPATGSPDDVTRAVQKALDAYFTTDASGLHDTLVDSKIDIIQAQLDATNAQIALLESRRNLLQSKVASEDS